MHPRLLYHSFAQMRVAMQRAKLAGRAFCVVTIVTLAACGGGGDDGQDGPPCDADCHATYIPAPAPQHQCTDSSCA